MLLCFLWQQCLLRHGVEIGPQAILVLHFYISPWLWFLILVKELRIDGSILTLTIQKVMRLKDHIQAHMQPHGHCCPQNKPEVITELLHISVRTRTSRNTEG